MKGCTKCGLEKDESEFYRNKRFGLTHWCKPCFKVSQDTRRRDNPELWAIRARDAAKRHYWSHHEEAKERLRIKGATQEFRKYQNRWKRTPKGRVHVARYNARRREVTKNDARLSLEDVHRLLHLQDNQCSACARTFTDELPYTLDHIHPASLGGVLQEGNVQLLCGSCNSRKGNRVEAGGYKLG